MKKYFSLLVFCAVTGFLNAQVNYYVNEIGDDTNDGLSESAPFKTLTAADAAIVDHEALDSTPNEYVINIAGTVTAGGSCSFKTSEATIVTIKGTSPATDIIQMKTDAEYEAAEADYGRFFDMTNAMSTNVHLIVQNLTIKNFGFRPAKSWGAGALCNQKNDYFELKDCVIMKGGSRSGTITQTATENCVFKMTNCYVSDLYSYIGQAGVFSPVRIRMGEGTISNCIFNTISKDFDASGYTPNAEDEINNGTVISAGDDASSSIATTLTITNNTFINCKITAGESVSGMPQSVVLIDTLNSNGVHGVIANNLFVDNLNDGTTEVDILNLWDEAEDSLIIVNNVMNAQTGINIDTNDVNADYTYASTEISIPLEGEAAQIFTAGNGIMYVKAEGTSIVGKADTAYTSTYDIIGTLRPDTASIGAVEYVAQTASLNSTQVVSFKVYPNPSVGSITISSLPSTSVVSIYNQLGQSIYTQQVYTNELKINSIKNGLYIVQVQANNETQTTQLIVR